MFADDINVFKGPYFSTGGSFGPAIISGGADVITTGVNKETRKPSIGVTINGSLGPKFLPKAEAHQKIDITEATVNNTTDLIDLNSIINLFKKTDDARK